MNLSYLVNLIRVKIEPITVLSTRYSVYFVKEIENTNKNEFPQINIFGVQEWAPPVPIGWFHVSV